MAESLNFLDGQIPRLKRRKRRVNLYEILGLVDSEAAADQTLAFFMDPNERHGMRTAMIDALLLGMDGHHVLDRGGRTDRTFDARRYLASTGWTVDRQVPAQGVEGAESGLAWTGIIDIYLTNRDRDIAIIVENKIWASLHNPLESYAKHALDEGYGTVLLTVLAPREHRLVGGHERWASGSTTYRSLLEKAREQPLGDGSGTEDGDRVRSAAILEQFVEIRERSQTVTDYASEMRFIGDFQKALKGKEESLAQFFDAQREVNRLFRTRSQRIGPLIDERLAHDGLAFHWSSHGASITNHWTYAWNAYQFERSKNSIELILDASPNQAAPITVKAYPGRDYKYYPDLHHTPIGVDWNSTDLEIVDALISKIVQIEQRHPGES